MTHDQDQAFNQETVNSSFHPNELKQISNRLDAEHETTGVHMRVSSQNLAQLDSPELSNSIPSRRTTKKESVQHSLANQVPGSSA